MNKTEIIIELDAMEYQALYRRDEAVEPNEDDCCPNCKTYLQDDNEVWGEFCPNCGQRTTGKAN